MEMQNLSDERYFIIFFTYEKDGNMCFGNSGYSHNSYVNAMRATDDIKEITKADVVIITNIIEVNKKDYDCYFE